MVSLHYHELMGKVKQHEGQKFLTVNDYMLDKILDKIKETIGIANFDDTKILVDTDDKLPDYNPLKITC